MSAYFRAKVLTGYAMALLSIALLYGAGLSLGVHLAPGKWITMTVLILVGLIPFNVLGILLGHLLSTDAIGPAMGGIVSLFACSAGCGGRSANGDSCTPSRRTSRRTGWCRPAAPPSAGSCGPAGAGS